MWGSRQRKARRAAKSREDANAGLPEESWFNALEGAIDQAAPKAAGGGRWGGPNPVLRPLAGHALRRIFATYVAARAALGVALVLAIALTGASAGRTVSAPLVLCGVYAVQSLIWWLTDQLRVLRALQSARWQWWMTIGVDLFAFGAIHWIDPTSSLNFAALLVLPVLMAGILTPRLPALATAAGVALMLLAAAGRVAGAVPDSAALMSQAGLSGLGLFVVALLSGELSMRLAHEERTARDSRERARQQAQLSRLVIEDMADGVLVIDRQLRVRAANPSARRLLVAQASRCPTPPFSLRLHPGWLVLADEVEQAFGRGNWPSAPIDLNIQLEDATRRALHIRARFTRSRSDGNDTAPADEPLCVLFIEELRAVQARLRQERLAAMGRISAGVAHEIRNPLAAISQANALLEEDELRPDQRRLIRIMTDNIDRLRRIVDDVMEAAPGSLAPSRTLDVTAEVASICSEWARTVGLILGSASRLQVLLPTTPVGVVFDSDHLRRVLVNLLDNAIRHASQAAGSVRISLETTEDGAWATLSVASDGAPIPQDVEPYLFEPFHSTRSRGTGLGLYICRELCERHGARIDFRRHDERHCNVFEVMMPRESLTSTEGRLVLWRTAVNPGQAGASASGALQASSVLVVDDEPDLLTLYELTLLREGLEVETASSVAQAREVLQSRVFRAVISDMRLPDGTGLDLLQWLEASGRPEKVIVVTAYGSPENAVTALKAGAFDYLTKPVDLRQFRAVVASAMGRTRATPPPPAVDAAPADGRGDPLRRLVGDSESMSHVRGLVEKVARSMAPVLVQGESGTGKELVARAIHDVSARAGQPFVAVNCGAIPETLLEAEFFGVRKGAFTGANADRDGFFQAANGGTLFLDEIGDLPFAMQSKLLRAIQERAVRAVGGTSEQTMNVRIVSATHKDLATEVQAGRFRQDLFYRLNVIGIKVPPLRERLVDLHAIADALLARLAREAGVSPPPRLAPDARALLARYAFPGNVRELEDLLHRAVALSDGEAITGADLALPEALLADAKPLVRDPEAGTVGAVVVDDPDGPTVADAMGATPQRAPAAPAALEPVPDDLVRYLDEVERVILVRALERQNFNRTAAGASLGLSLRQMRYRMARLGITESETSDPT